MVLKKTCGYSFVAPGQAIRTTSVFRPEKGQLLEIPGSTNTTALDADPSVQVHEADEAGRWFGTITQEVFG